MLKSDIIHVDENAIIKKHFQLFIHMDACISVHQEKRFFGIFPCVNRVNPYLPRANIEFEGSSDGTCKALFCENNNVRNQS